MNLNSSYNNLGTLFYQKAFNNKKKALTYPDKSNISFQELNRLANRIANYLLDFGIKKNDVIVILNNNTDTSYSLMIACLKIGAIYSNLDPKSPIERFKKMVAVCRPKMLFYFDDQKIISKEFNLDFENKFLINYESQSFSETIEGMSIHEPKFLYEIEGATPAYIMFTSGSTGFPKGVVISHSNVLNFIQWAKETYSIVSEDVFTNMNPMHFDNSVFDFYASLFNGASLIPLNNTYTRNPRRLIEALNICTPTIWFSVPSMLVFILNMRALRDNDLPSLRIVTFGGEGFPKNQLRLLWKKWGDRIKFINVYGPTECTCICTSYVVKPEDIDIDNLLPLGSMANNFYGLVVNHKGEISKQDEVGELYIGGANVGLGYINNTNKTNEVFINNPFSNKINDLVYKSGDLVTYNSFDDRYHFVGRTDNQIKRMGYRIELEEIENALNSLSIISESAVIYVNTSKHKEKIIACITTDVENDAALKDQLKDLVPLYMVPDIFIFLPILPKNQNGKIDRLKLKEKWSR